MFSLYDLRASLSLFPVPGDALLAEELPREAEPEDAVPEVAALEAVAPGVAVFAPVIPPACAPQDTLVRVALMATHTKDQIDRAVEKLVKAFKTLDLL